MNDPKEAANAGKRWWAELSADEAIELAEAAPKASVRGSFPLLEDEGDPPDWWPTGCGSPWMSEPTIGCNRISALAGELGGGVLV